jgi:hypothetical protein
MEEMNKEFRAGKSESSDTASAGRRLFVGAGIAAAALVAVMLLMLVAVQHAPSTMAIDTETKSGNSSPEVYAENNIVIESLKQTVRTGAMGTREIEIKGYIRNTGDKTVGSAVLRCYFKTYSGTETFLDTPLIVATRLEDMDCGPLGPSSSRRFDVRSGDFPDNLLPEIVRYEFVNVSFLAL